MRKLLLAVGSSLVAFLVLASMPAGTSDSPASTGQLSQSTPIPTPTLSFEYEVLPGLHPSGAAIALEMTQGWHSGSIDMVPDEGAAVGATVRAAFETITFQSGITAIAGSVIRTGNGCRQVEIRFFRRGRTTPIGSVLYTHVIPNDDVIPNKTPVDLSSGKVLGTLALGSLVRVPEFRNDAVARSIDAEIDRRVAAGTLVESPSDTYGDVQYVWVGGTRYLVRHMFGSWYEQRWRPNDPRPSNGDGEECATTAAHLHQQGDLRDTTSLWRNADRTDRVDDDGLGFDDASIFCSDTWIFKLYPAAPAGVTLGDWAPPATPVEPCGAPDVSPANLAATGGNGRITLSWDNPNDVTITGYQVRSRLTSATAPAASPWGSGWSAIPGSGATTTSHGLTGLNNGTAYTMQLRAVNANGNGPAATVSATPRPPPPPPTTVPLSFEATSTGSTSSAARAAATSAAEAAFNAAVAGYSNVVSIVGPEITSSSQYHSGGTSSGSVTGSGSASGHVHVTLAIDTAVVAALAAANSRVPANATITSGPTLVSSSGPTFVTGSGWAFSVTYSLQYTVPRPGYYRATATATGSVTYEEIPF